MRALQAALLSVGAVTGAALIGSTTSRRTPDPVWQSFAGSTAGQRPGRQTGALQGGLQALLGVAGFTLLTGRGGVQRAAALTAWGMTLLGVADLPLLFLDRKSRRLAARGATVAAASATTLTAARTEPLAAAAMIPLLAWSAFALLLTEETGR